MGMHVILFLALVLKSELASGPAKSKSSFCKCQGAHRFLYKMPGSKGYCQFSKAVYRGLRHLAQL